MCQRSRWTRNNYLHYLHDLQNHGCQFNLLVQELRIKPIFTKFI